MRLEIVYQNDICSLRFALYLDSYLHIIQIS